MKIPCYPGKLLNVTCATRRQIRYGRGAPSEMNTLGRGGHDMEEVQGVGALASLLSYRFLIFGITLHMRKI
jgi:hypothetical protein